MNGVSKSQLSRLCEESERVDAVHERSIGPTGRFCGSTFPHAKARQNGCIVSAATIIADRINAKQRRETHAAKPRQVALG